MWLCGRSSAAVDMSRWACGCAGEVVYVVVRPKREFGCEVEVGVWLCGRSGSVVELSRWACGCAGEMVMWLFGRSWCVVVVGV